MEQGTTDRADTPIETPRDLGDPDPTAAQRVRDLALFFDSKLRGCDLVKLQVRDVAHSGRVIPRATVMQQKTGQPVKFELTEQTREAVKAWKLLREE